MAKVTTHNWLCLDEVDSTNLYAKRCKVPAGTVLLATRQTAGKGRDGRHFVSREGGMYLSVVRGDDLPIAEAVKYTYAAPLAVWATLAEYGIEASVKWPNDVWVEGAKIAGILIENELSEGRVTRCIVGIGLNVYNDLTEVPCAATGLHMLGVEAEVCEVAKRVVGKLDLYLEMDTQSLLESIRPVTLNIGRMVMLADGTQGVAEDIAADGRLAVRVGQQIRYVAAGDVSLKEELC